MNYPETIGVVLSGGRSRRMGGGDKANIRIGGATILERIIARLVPQCSRLILSANGDAGRFAGSGLAIVSDSIGDYAGPLAGILAGLDWVAEHASQTAWVVSAPGDCPFLPHDLVERLHQTRIAVRTRLACARSGDRRHPVIALWPVALRDDLRRALVTEGVRKVEQWAARYAPGIAEWSNAPIDPFFNVNTPEDAAEAGRIAAQYPQA